MAGAVIGAVLALFIIAVFVTVLLTPRKKRPSYLDKVIDLPPTHKPPPAYEERSPPLPQKDLRQAEHWPLRMQSEERDAGTLPPSSGLNSRRVDCGGQKPAQDDKTQQLYALHKQMCCQERSARRHHQHDGPERPCVHPREHYV